MVDEERFGRDRRRKPERAKISRLYQRVKSRPRQFSPEQKEAVKFRQETGMSQREAFSRFKPLFERGELSKGQFEKFKRITDLDADWTDFKAFRKLKKEGLDALSESEFSKANNLADLNISRSQFSSYKKLTDKGLSELSPSEFRKVKQMGVLANVPERDFKIYKKAQNKGLDALSRGEAERLSRSQIGSSDVLQSWGVRKGLERGYFERDDGRIVPSEEFFVKRETLYRSGMTDEGFKKRRVGSYGIYDYPDEAESFLKGLGLWDRFNEHQEFDLR